MAFSTASNVPWTRIKALSFDIFGTLVDWEGGIDASARETAIGPHLPSNRPQFLKDINRLDNDVQKQHPTWKQSDVIAEGMKRYAAELGVVKSGKLTQEQVDEACKEYGSKIGDYPAFDDTVKAIQRLAKHYKLIPLTNVDNASFSRTMSGPLKGCDFDAIYTAEDIGSYKPDLKNFHYLLNHLKQDFGVEKGDLCHVAQSLFHDHGPASELQLLSVWVDRKGAIGGETEAAQEKYQYQLRVESLEELANIVDAAFGTS